MERYADSDEACGWIISPYITPLRAVRVTALPSFCRVLILSVSSASSTPSFIGSTLWVFHHVSLPCPRSVNCTFFALAHLGLSARHSSCVHAPRAPGVDCLVTHGGGEGAWLQCSSDSWVLHRQVQSFRKPEFQSNSAWCQFRSLSTRIVYVPNPLQRPVPTFSRVVLFPQVQYINKVVDIPSRCGDHRQYPGMDWRIYHVLPPHMGDNTTNLPHHRSQEMMFFHLVENRLSEQQFSHEDGPELATTKSALTSQEEFFLFALETRPRHIRDPERAASISLFSPLETSVLAALCRQGTSHSPGTKQATALRTSTRMA